MTNKEFNKKYHNFLGKGSYGLAIENKTLTNYLDQLFSVLIHFPKFEYYQIKVKYDSPRFYTSLGQNALTRLIEDEIGRILNG